MEVIRSHVQRRVLRRIAYARRNRCSVLVVALCLLILANPLFARSSVGVVSVATGLLVVLVLAVWALRMRRPLVWGAALLAFLSFDAVVAHRLGETWLQPVVLAATALLLAIVTLALLLYVLDRKPITADKVFGAVAAYMLIAFSFASLFGLLQFFEPDAFNAAVAHGVDGKLNWSDMMYFSFTVLTSTGFGEITPATHMARALIVIEQVLGVMYVAFLIARLANMYGVTPNRG